MSFVPSAPRYAAVPHARSVLSAQEFLLVTRAGERHVMTADVLDALERMAGFATLEEHRERLVQANPELGKAGDQVLRVLQGLVQRGLLRDERERQTELTAVRALPDLGLRVVLFLTGRDPQPLLRALAQELAGDTVRVSEVLVLVPPSVSVDSAALAEAAAPLKLRVLALAEVQQWLHDLGEGVEPGAGPQAQRLADAPANLALLLGAGQRVLWLDDRQHLPLRIAVDADAQLALDENTARSVGLYGDHRQALQAGKASPGALLELVRLCGAPLGALGRALDPGLVGLRTLAELECLSADSSLRSVVCGTLGCAEGEHSLWMYLLDGKAREQLCQSRAHYDRGIEAEALSHGVREARLQRGGAYRPLLLDASRLHGLVPGSALHSERVLHALGSYVAPSSLVAQMPHALGFSVRLARERAQTNLAVIAPSLNGFVADQAALRRDELLSPDPQRRLEVLAEQLRDLAQCSIAQRRALLWEYLSFQQSQTIAALQNAIEQAGAQAPQFWHQDVAAIVQNYGQGLLQARVARLAETPDSVDQSEAAAHLGVLLESAALKLELWPHLHAAALAHPI